MSDTRARLATTIPSELDEAVRVLAAQYRTSIASVVTALLRHGVETRDRPEVIAALEATINESRELRAEIGRQAMDSRYGRDGGSS